MKKFVGVLLLFLISFLWLASPPTTKAISVDKEYTSQDVPQVTLTTCNQDAMILTDTDPGPPFVLNAAGYMEQPDAVITLKVMDAATDAQGITRYYKPYSLIGSGGPLNRKYLDLSAGASYHSYHTG